MERRLVTILAADAVGYSRLVANDEEAALALFDECSAAMTDLVRNHHGRVFGGAGDSLIAEFASPVEALRCAVQMQREVAGINEKLAEERRMQFRVGLNLGDAVVEQGVLFGDAVNIASRLEGLSAPGGVCISGNLYEHVKHLPDFGFQDLGPVKLKNIPVQVHAYAVQGTSLRPFGRRRARLAWAAAAAVLALAAAAGLWRFMPVPPESGGVPEPALASHPSIAVLPLENLSGDPQQEYFSDGITNDITTDLSKFPDLLVVASNSAFTFKGRHIKVQEIGAELGVRYLLEGTMQKAADRLRINAQLIDVTSGMHLWADRYDREAEHIF
ncbi:MAG TPA: adenylate/guanylate cyclase domain-containing protein, partial [Geminicoccaceae bacterium]|nr:adenylate/guanylate cyclase domain-containing protein [Geminicoccaceae bacterium]